MMSVDVASCIQVWRSMRQFWHIHKDFVRTCSSQYQDRLVLFCNFDTMDRDD